MAEKETHSENGDEHASAGDRRAARQASRSEWMSGISADSFCVDAWVAGDAWSSGPKRPSATKEVYESAIIQ